PLGSDHWGKGDMSDEDDENEFFDAPEIITMPENLGHKRTGSHHHHHH
nr:Chain B, Oxysterol-binding protein 1 [Homo sapiens]